MNWITLVENPKAITHLYGEVPPLQGTAVKKVSLDRNGPTLKFEMDLPRFADHVPARWEKGSNTVHIELDFYWISDLKLTGFSTNPIFDFSVERRLDGILVSAGDKDSQITFLCQNIYIRQVSGYINRPPGPPPAPIAGTQ
jgi:hypothetical protein